MKQLVSIILIVLCLPLQAGQWRGFELESLPGFAVQGFAEGRIRISDKCVCFEIDEARAWVLAKLENVSTEVVGMRFGLAYRTGPERWKVLGYSPRIAIGQIVSSGHPIKIGSFDTSIPIPEGLAEENHWVVMEIAERHASNDGLSFSYAHEKQGLNRD